MALLYVDQFVGYETTGNFESPIPYLFPSGWQFVLTTYGFESWFRLSQETLPGRVYATSFFEIRLGTVTGNRHGACVQKLLDTPASYVAAGFSWAITTTFSSEFVIARFNGNFTNTETANSVVATPAGEIRCNGVSSDPLLYTPYMYLTIVCDTAAGEIRVYKNSDVTTPILVAPTAITEVTSVSWGAGALQSAGNGSIHRFSDVYILDDTGPAPFNAPLGIVQYKPLPLVSEVNTDFVPMGGAASNLAAVNKDTRSFTTYNRSQVSNGLYDRFTVDDSAVDPTDTVLGVVLHTTALRDVGEPRTLALEMTDTGGTVSEDFSDLTVGAWADNRYAVFTTEGDGTTPLTPASLSDIEVGYRVKA